MSCEDGNKLSGGPYYASLMTPSVHHTMGGLTIDKDTRVLNKAGKPIPGLFAAGKSQAAFMALIELDAMPFHDALIYGTIAGREVGK